jgi:hypothetical protein
MQEAYGVCICGWVNMCVWLCDCVGECVCDCVGECVNVCGYLCVSACLHVVWVRFLFLFVKLARLASAHRFCSVLCYLASYQTVSTRNTVDRSCQLLSGNTIKIHLFAFGCCLKPERTRLLLRKKKARPPASVLRSAALAASKGKFEGQSHGTSRFCQERQLQSECQKCVRVVVSVNISLLVFLGVLKARLF